MNALEVCGLKKVYPSFTLEKVSFSVEEGRACGLVGANGAGKSTILKGIAGLIRTEGEAKVFGYPSCGEAGKALFGYAGGGFRCYPQKRIGAIARAAAAFYPAWDSDGFHRYCNRFSLDPRKKVAELSEGMKVKFALALALSHGAKLLVLDEPTSGLDPLSREEFCDVVLSLVREKGVAVLFSTHVTSDLNRIADDIVLLSNGRILADGSLKGLIARYLLASAPNRETLSAATGVKPVKAGYEGLVSRDNPPPGVSLRAPSLDEIVIHLEYGRRAS